MDESWLPALITLEEFSGQWEKYLEAAYQIFSRDFIRSKPLFCGERVSLKRHPIELGKEATFWHFVQEGPIEADRIPNLRRFERISWIRPIIEAAGTRTDLKIWDQIRRKNERRIVVALEDFSYVVVIAERERDDLSAFHLPWTAYPAERQHERDKLRKQFEASGQCFVRGVCLKG